MAGYSPPAGRLGRVPQLLVLAVPSQEELTETAWPGSVPVRGRLHPCGQSAHSTCQRTLHFAFCHIAYYSPQPGTLVLSQLVSEVELVPVVLLRVCVLTLAMTVVWVIALAAE